MGRACSRQRRGVIMKVIHRSFAAATSLILLAATPAMAASSDYLLTLDDLKDGASHPTTIEVASWSFGASSPTSVGASGMSAGRRLTAPPASNGQVSVLSAREASSGMATGRRACATGKHYASAILTNRAQSWKLA